jgi:hypothetical protein
MTGFPPCWHLQLEDLELNTYFYHTFFLLNHIFLFIANSLTYTEHYFSLQFISDV